MSKKLHIAFLLPYAGTHPSGGYKIVYSYANSLKDDFDVDVVHCAVPLYDGVFGLFRAIVVFFYKFFLSTYSPRHWFELDDSVNIRWIPFPQKCFLKKYDRIIATSWQTAYALHNLGIEYENVIYLIQGYEIWSGNKEKVHETYKYGYKNIVISFYLHEVLRDIGVNSYIVRNPADLDFKYFISQNDRNPLSILFLAHHAPNKGMEETLKIVNEVRRRHPTISVGCFCSREIELPDWISLIVNPSKEDLVRMYNNSSIFISSSKSEGWGLTVFEAMQSGCVVVVSNIAGYKEFVVDGHNGFLYELGNIIEAVDTIDYIIENPKKVKIISENASKIYMEFDISVAKKQLSEIINE